MRLPKALGLAQLAKVEGFETHVKRTKSYIYVEKVERAHHPRV